MSPTSRTTSQPPTQRGPRAVIGSLAAAALCVLTAGAGGCSSGKSQTSQSPARTPGHYPASAFVTQKYGITRWRASYGPNWIVMTGYGADGKAVRGVEMSWHATTSTAPGHTRLKMLDGSGAAFRRTVEGGQSGHLSSTQVAFVQALRTDLMTSGGQSLDQSSAQVGLVQATGGDPMRPGASLVGRDGMIGQRLSVANASSASASLFEATPNTGPNTGPKCLEAQLGAPNVLDVIDCLMGLARFRETLVDPRKLAETGYACVSWYTEQREANAVCAQENLESCVGDTCVFGPNYPTPDTEPTPEPQEFPTYAGDNIPGDHSKCGMDCVCANYGWYDGKPCYRICIDSSVCDEGQECHWGQCGPPQPKDDHPTDDNVTLEKQARWCNGDASAEVSNGDVTCNTPKAEDSSSGGWSEIPGFEDPSVDFVSRAACVGDGGSCTQDGDCCISACIFGTCGVTAESGGDSDSGDGACSPDDPACVQDVE